MKHEWRKHEKSTYLPGTSPEVIDVPEFRFVTISGSGNPAKPEFAEHIAPLYAAAYAIKMTLKSTPDHAGLPDYTVYPLEGVWSIREAARASFTGVLDKDDLVFKLMIRQPDTVEEDFALEMFDLARKKKPLPLLDQLKFERIREGSCVQAMHLGSFDTEPESFARMEQFAADRNYLRRTKQHREIYLSDFRKVAPDKLKTVLRFPVDPRPKPVSQDAKAEGHNK